jgi:hypothetical protein
MNHTNIIAIKCILLQTFQNTKKEKISAMVKNNYTKLDKITSVRCQGQNKNKTSRILCQLHKQNS